MCLCGSATPSSKGPFTKVATTISRPCWCGPTHRWGSARRLPARPELLLVDLSSVPSNNDVSEPWSGPDIDDGSDVAGILSATKEMVGPGEGDEAFRLRGALEDLFPDGDRDRVVLGRMNK